MTKKIFFSPHSDDAALYGAFTIQRERPLVVTLAEAARETRMEDRLAMEILGAHSVDFCGLTGDDGLDCAVLRRVMAAYGHAAQVWAPWPEDHGNRDHNKVGKVAAELFPGMVTFYLTHTSKGKSTKGVLVPIAEPRWVAGKLRALACYESQMPDAQEHFLRDQREYYADPAKVEAGRRNWGNQ